MFWSFEHLNFEFVSDFGFRASNFKFYGGKFTERSTNQGGAF